MIEAIRLANEGAYDEDGTLLSELRPLNFVFGPNGSGKTTISRVIDGSGTHPDCAITWAAGAPLETRVYHRDFVEKHFDTPGSIKGIYTLGDGNVEAVKTVAALKAEEEDISNKLKGLRKTLHGDDGQGGKTKERDDLDVQLRDDVWKAKAKFDELSDAFSGVNKSKAKFVERYLNEAENNKADLRDIADLRTDAASVFSNELSHAQTVPKPDCTALVALENDAILSKKVIGKADVDIAALIEKLGNSDWVQQGREYFKELDDQCPFCQQKTDAAFRQSLEEYFDESYVNDLAAIESLRADYAGMSTDLLDAYGTTAVTESPFLDREAFDKDLATLRLALEANAATIEDKRKEPSAAATLKDTASLFAAVDAHIDAANASVQVNNDTLANLDARKRTLTSQVWRRLLEDSKPIYGKYKADALKLDSAINGLSTKIDERTKELQAKGDEIEENEKKITSIKPTIEEINKLLKSFGFVNFHLVESTDDGFYEVKRPGGEDAKGSLSEGEKSFITFLYFYHHVKGSFSSSGANTNRIVVFDDPVSSLDADILFIVCNLIKGIVNEMRDGAGAIKQVFVLTHNIYFHKEITFHKRRSGADAMNDETFWIIRKSTSRSELIRSPENPIKSSYELLWREVRQDPPSDTAIQNVMRRILEHYFKFFGGVAPEEIIEEFEGKEKMICGSLFSWINDGSHFANDDLFMSCDPGQIDRYLSVFRRIFEVSGHHGHYKMMMGDSYSELPLKATEQEPEIEAEAPEVLDIEDAADSSAASNNA
ncbi:AAA family ATPase [Lutimaribacter sp. EGI FJ00015]|uniref:AAA family ATPase n=1 Tax=Lutimaribacter degradans TaxID=2945989 RepID=A0ACC5ZU84_9RHOB|nr:AAA family ATPase [Lutimaribacter sp. EGI FJ00013]MCM2561745.1 AAA family ATPase [Lutimaribacter sp. EGI FJ00013]MCO0613223.1 AAA family ATPase [Lutimaribacter sp. EGI FJ00015]MCO0635577.1 AAA family ATPase [Lutimaribacter sp. EGI FJ00014]